MRFQMGSKVALFSCVIRVYLSSVQMSPAPETTMRRKSLNFLRWLPVAASVTLLAMVALISAGTMSELKNAIYWRQHSFQEILAAQAYEGNIMSIQNGMRDFVTMGDAAALASCQRCIKLEPQLFDQLVSLTRDNPAQQQRLKILSAAMKDVFDYDGRLIDIYKQQGAEAVLWIEQTGKGRVFIGRARDILATFSNEEQKLLSARDATEQADYYNAERLLIISSAFAVALLVLANFMVGREMARRRRVEIERVKLIGELQQTLAQVKTLSGLIPICAWCKSIRNDQGYWQSVEQYVHSHSDASFSHSICPSCREKFKDEIAKISGPAEKSPSGN
jgi:CHASE3 domain sensor protein